MAGPLVILRPRGQVFPLMALFLSALLILVMAALSYGVLTVRLMDALGAADLAAHAGAMQIHVLPDGRYESRRAERVAREVFTRHHLPYAHLQGVTCGVDARERPWCEVVVEVEGALWAPNRTIHARSVLAAGVTREDQ